MWHIVVTLVGPAVGYSDGLFDVMTNQEAVDFVNSFLSRGVTGGGPTGRCSSMVASFCIVHATSGAVGE